MALTPSFNPNLPGEDNVGNENLGGNGSGGGLGAQTPDTQEPTSRAAAFAQRQSNFVAGADLDAQQQGSKSFLENASDIVTKGIPLTGAAVVNSFYNTFAEVGNFLGADMQEATIENEFGPDSDTTQYYQQHSGVIEGAALAAGSLIPGLGALKVLKLAQAGKFGAGVSITTGLLSGMRTAAIDSAAADMAGNATGQSLFGLSQVSKVKAILAGAGENALQGAVYATATLATTHANPLTDNNTLSDDISDVLDSAKMFGMFGGVIDGAQAVYKINRGLLEADKGSKLSEILSGLAGKGNLTPGDRVVGLYKSIDQLPTPTTDLSRMKDTITRNTAGRKIQDQLINLAGGDEDLATSFRQFLEAGRSDGSISQDDLVNNLGQLSKIGRHGDTSIASTPSDVFYVPKSIDAGSVATATHDDLMTRIATDTTAGSRALVLTNPNILPTIGRATDTDNLLGITANGPMTVPKYANVADAYKKGVDIFVDSNGGTHLNLDSDVWNEVARPGESRILGARERQVYNQTGNLPPSSKPLNAVGLTLDLVTKKLFGDEVLPVVGDIGKPKVTPNGLQVADHTFLNRAGTEFDPATANPLEANARYVWAAMRGIKSADSIHPEDLPMLEQLYRERAVGINHPDVTYTDGSVPPADPQALLQHIADVKQAKYADLLAAGKNADEIGHTLNAPTRGMTENFNTTDPGKLILPPETSSSIRHVRLAYDIGTTKDSEGNLLRGMQATDYRMQLARQTNLTQVSSYLSTFFGPQVSSAALSALQFTKGIGDADIAGAGARFFTNANADFGTLAQQAERMGASARDLSTVRRGVVSDTLSRATNALKADLTASTEYGNFRTVRQMTGENYILLNPQEASSIGLPGNYHAVLEGAISTNGKTGQLTYNPSYIPPKFVAGDTPTTDALALKTYYPLSQKVADLELASQSLVNARNQARNNWWAAQGITKDTPNPRRIYTPPVDGSKYPFFAYMTHRASYAMGESGASVVTANSAAELQSKIAAFGPEYDAFTKSELRKHFTQGGSINPATGTYEAAKAQFDFNRNFMTNRANTEMARKGILNNITPETRPQNLINDLVNWHFNQEDLLLRDHIELHNAATFDQLRAMGERFDQTGTARFGAITPFMAKSATNPYNTYIRTALGLTSKDDYPLWQLAQEKVDSLATGAFNRVKEAFGAMQRGILPAEQAAEVSKRFGLGNPYGDTLDRLKDNYYGGIANQLPDQKIFSKFVGVANTVLGATVIRLDTFQQLIHAVTMPIMTALEYGSASKDLQNLLRVTVPGTQTQVPGFMRVMYNSVRNFFKDDGTLSSFYARTGMPTDEINGWRQMTNELTMPLGKLSDSGWAQKIDNAAKLGEKLTGSKWTNSFIHFVTSDIGRQLGQSMGQSGQDLLDTIGTFTNRSMGGLSAGARAGIFQGPLGQAVGLFQSFQWNLMQQLLRHIGEGDVKALAMGAGLQGSIFGLSSLPGFHALNQIIMNRHGNTEGKDLYSAATETLGDTAANYLLYGGLSGLLGTALYSRGDINPRRATILPVNPMDFPTVHAGINIYNMLTNLENNLTTKGGNIPASLLLAAEHNSLSRPLAGIAQLAQGYTTNSVGDRIAGLNDLDGISTMSRILGARPLDEAVRMDAMYRANSLKVLDTARLQELGMAAKTALYSGNPVSPEVAGQFMSDYVKAGGTQDNFNQWFLQQTTYAQVGTLNKTMQNFRSPRYQTLQMYMGGMPLPSVQTNSPQTPQESQTPQTPQTP